MSSKMHYLKLGIVDQSILAKSISSNLCSIIKFSRLKPEVERLDRLLKECEIVPVKVNPQGERKGPQVWEESYSEIKNFIKGRYNLDQSRELISIMRKWESYFPGYRIKNQDDPLANFLLDEKQIEMILNGSKAPYDEFKQDQSSANDLISDIQNLIRISNNVIIIDSYFLERDLKSKEDTNNSVVGEICNGDVESDFSSSNINIYSDKSSSRLESGCDCHIAQKVETVNQCKFKMLLRDIVSPIEIRLCVNDHRKCHNDKLSTQCHGRHIIAKRDEQYLGVWSLEKGLTGILDIRQNAKLAEHATLKIQRDRLAKMKEVIAIIERSSSRMIIHSRQDPIPQDVGYHDSEYSPQ